MKRTIFTILTLCVAFSVSAQMKISGRLLTNDGKPIEGVVVSDGFSNVLTDSKGRYKMTTAKDAYHVAYSIPADYAVSVKEGHPDFYKKLERGVKTYDFTLTPLEKSEEKFSLIMVADPQAQCDFHVKRFERETVPDIRACVEGIDVPCYAITLGDIGYTEGNHDATGFIPKMREAMSADKTGVPFFHTIGNHDNAMAPIEVEDEQDIDAINIVYQRPFEQTLGPVNYSWNRGNVHIISLKDTQYLSAEKSSKYRLGLSKAQYEWLKSDLENVPKDKMVLLCVHIGLYERKNPYIPQVRELLSQFKEAHIMVGHTHFMNHRINDLGIYEHVHAAASGAFWWSCANGDGVPNGYTVYDIDGAHITNWRYKSVGHSFDYQIRMYRGDAEFGGEYETFRLPYTHSTVLANVFMADPNWKVELYEDGELTGEMRRLPVTKDSVPEANTSRDWWAVGYHLGVIGRSYGKVKGTSHWSGGGRKGYLTACNHMYCLELKNPDAKEIKVVATDTNGNVYTQTKFTESFDYSEMELTNKLRTIYRSKLDKEY